MFFILFIFDYFLKATIYESLIGPTAEQGTASHDLKILVLMVRVLLSSFGHQSEED